MTAQIPKDTDAHIVNEHKDDTRTATRMRTDPSTIVETIKLKPHSCTFSTPDCVDSVYLFQRQYHRQCPLEIGVTANNQQEDGSIADIDHDARPPQR
eukprot:COSAG01_NODE_5192_length_4420_cov_38.410553_6_plen_97_part_00